MDSVNSLLKEKLNKLERVLSEIKKSDRCEINIFPAVGVIRQEVKHSAFLAWLLDPASNKYTGKKFLKYFICELMSYGKGSMAENRNKRLFEAQNIKNLSDMDDFIAADDISVQTEKVLVSAESRMDIYICSEKAETVVIIENKVFTANHDEQLRRYDEEIKEYIGKENYNKYKKIYVYLTPKGDMPADSYDDKEANGKWCLFDYAGILKIVDKLKAELFGGRNNRSEDALRLKFLLEDYEKTVYKEILKKDAELRRLCKKILREHKEALDILAEYTDNSAEVAEYCKQILHEEYKDVYFIDGSEGKDYFEFYTQTIYDYFISYGEKISDGGYYKLRGIFSCRKGNVEICLGMQNLGSDWSFAQKEIAEKIGGKLKSKYYTFNKFILLTENERQDEFDELLKERVTEKLNLYINAINAVFK